MASWPSVGKIAAALLAGLWRAVRHRLQLRHGGHRALRAWVEQRAGLWYVRRADGQLWTGTGWAAMGSSYATREHAQQALEHVSARGLATVLP